MSNENLWKVIELSSKCYSVSEQSDKFYRPKSNSFLNETSSHVFWKTKEALLKDFPDTPPEDIKEYTGEVLETYSNEMGLDGSDFRVFTETDSFW